MQTDQQAFEELHYYTLAHNDPSFIHQHIVDAFAAQNNSENDKPIKLTFALVGLYLHVEKHFTGRQVQLAHMKLGRNKQKWPTFVVPINCGLITIQDVVATPAGPDRDQMIHLWCESVWKAYSENRQIVINLLEKSKII